MKGIPGRVTKALPSQAKLECADNTGAKVVQLITVLNKGGVARRYPVSRRRRHDQSHRQKRYSRDTKTDVQCSSNQAVQLFRRVDGTWVQFEDNACVITNERKEVQGSDIKGPVSREAAERWPRIAATAKQIV